MASDGTLRFDTSLDTNGLQKDTRSLGDIAKNALGVFSGNMMMKATEAVINLGKQALQAGMNFEASMAKTSTLFSGSDEQFAALNKTVLELSSSTGLAADGLAEAAYSALSAGVASEDLGFTLEKSAKLAAAGFTDVDTALSATAKTMNAYGVTGEEAMDKVQKVLMQTQNLGITTVGELGQSLAQVTPTAAAFGVSFEQVGASLAVMTAQGTPTAQATTQLNALIAELGKNGTTAANNLQKAAEGSKYAGMSFNEMMESGATLDEVLGMMQKSADESGMSMVDMFSSIEAGKAAMSIFSQEGSTFHNNLAQMSTDADVVGEAYEKVSDTLQFKSQQIKTSLTNIGISLFEMASGPLGDAAGAAASALEEIQKGLSENGLAGIGDALVNIMEKAATALENFDWTAAADKITEKISNLISGNGTGKLLTAAGHLLAALVKGLVQFLPRLLPAAIKLITYLSTSLIRNLPKLIQIGWDLVKAVITGLLSMIPSVGPAAAQIVGKIIEVMTTLPGRIWTILVNVLNRLIAWGQQMLSQASMSMTNMLSRIIAIVTTLPGRLWTILVNALNRLIAWGQQMLSQASTAMTNMLSRIIAIVTTLPGRLWTILVNALNRLIAWGQQMLSQASTSMTNMLSRISSIVSALPGQLWTHLANALNRLISWGQQMLSQASTAMSNMLSRISSVLSQLPGQVWNWLSQVISKAATWVSQMTSKGAEAAKGLANAVINGLSGLPSRMASIGSDIVQGIWSGISSGWGWLKSKVADLAQSLLNAAKSALGISSPSKEFRDEIGKWLPPGIAEGFEDAMPRSIKEMQREAAMMVAMMQRAIYASAGQLTFNAGGAASLRAIGSVGTIVNNDNHFEQENTYNVPVATPSEVAKAQREALRNLVGGVK